MAPEDMNVCREHGLRFATPADLTAHLVEVHSGKHVGYPHEPGTLYDCPACDMPD